MEKPAHRSLTAFLFGIPISFLGGLIGLGGAEFRLPVLGGIFKIEIKQAIPLNLLISFFTLITAVMIRLIKQTPFPSADQIPAVIGLITGAVTAAFWGPKILKHAPASRLRQAVLVLLVSAGILMLAHGFLKEPETGLVHLEGLSLFLSALPFGLLIGLFSSLLGVAGGELLIPTLVFIFGLPIKQAGAGTMLVSIPTVLVALLRYWRLGAFFNRENIRQSALPMAFGSILGAILGALLVNITPAASLYLALGCILIYSSVKVFGEK